MSDSNASTPPEDAVQAGAGTSGPRDDGPSAAHRLPRNVVPRRYDLHLTPDLDAGRFEGEVEIEVEIVEPADMVVLNAAELEIEPPTFSGSGGTSFECQVELDEMAERAVILLPEPAQPGPAKIRMRFSGVLNDKLHGFYRSTFEDQSGISRTIATTQFEATDARRAFPCFDEPDRKAIFGVTLHVREGLSAYSNGAVVEETDHGDGLRHIHFEETIPMSTYLVAFVVGPLEATRPVDVDGTRVRVVHVPGKANLTAFAIEVAAHALRFFTEWFGLPYPASKLDLVAIPDFAFGAMENLGCVTFRESALLIDPDNSSRLEQERVADVISHEIAHMWFGDLVTMRWWNGIWLNEAFATLMELLCVDHFRPDWHRWVSFGAEREAAMSTDALHSTRPVEYPVGPPEEAQGMFDVLTYQKGAAVLRMLERYLGPERFQEGIRQYLSSHLYSNTETSDLWDAIELTSGEPVRSMMDSWILQGGYPIVSVGRSAGNGFALEQHAFSLASPEGPSSIGERWSVPVIARFVGQPSGENVRLLLDGESARVDPGSSSGPLLVNSGGTGFYRVAYDHEHLRSLVRSFASLDALERFGLVGDTWAAVVAGRGTLDQFLVLSNSLQGETDPDVLGAVTRVLDFVDHVLVDDAAIAALAAYTRALLLPALRSVGWERRPGEDERRATLRARLIGTLGVVGKDGEVLGECSTRHSQVLDGSRALDADIAAAVLGVVASIGGAEEYEEVLERYRHPADPQEEIRYLYALAGFRDAGLPERTFELALREIRTQNAPFVVQALLSNKSAGDATWRRVEDRFDEMAERFPAQTIPRMLQGVEMLCRDAALADRIHTFVDAHPVQTGQRTVGQSVERLHVNVRLAEHLAGSAEATLREALKDLGEAAR